VWLSVIATKVVARDFQQQMNGPYRGDIRSFAVNSSGHIFAGTNSVWKFHSVLPTLLSACTPIAYDQKIDGTIAIAGEEDCFIFTGTAGHRVNVLLDHRTSIFDYFSLRLKKPNGDSLAFCNFTNGDCEIGNLTLPATGLYTIVVDGRGASVGNYTLALSCHTSPCGVTGNLGDINNDGNCNSTDALIILSYDVGLPIPQDFLDRIQAGLGDVNADNLTNSADALIILASDAGMQVPFPVCRPF
jgi:hypothetical protein